MSDHVFVCYARKNQNFVLKLVTFLKEQNVPVWIDQWHIPPSADWDQTIDEAIDDCANFLIVLSPEAIKSKEVRGELRAALNANKPIVPVLYQPCRIPRQLLTVQYVDYTPQGPGEADALKQLLRFLGEPAPTTHPQFLSPRNPFEPELIFIPAGEFLMGSDPKEDKEAKKDKDAEKDEQPQHPVHLPDYYMAKTPVTNVQYAAFVQASGYQAPYLDTDWIKPYNWDGQKPPTGKEDHPVVLVSWHDAVAYCQWLTKTTARIYRLPTEAEWEKAARGTDGRIYPWGNEWDERLSNTQEGDPRGTTPVGTYPDGASPYGLLDMAGNVWEWCATKWKKSYPYDVTEDEWSAEYLEGDSSRVLRGCSWGSDRYYARCAFRGWDDPLRFNASGGFRLASPI